MNWERPNERRAKRIVERHLGISLEHADKNGGVDYLMADGLIAVEVTRVTDEDVLKGKLAWAQSNKSEVTSASLQTCWMVIIPEALKGMKTFRKRVHPLVAQLEAAGLERFEDGSASVDVLRGKPNAELFRQLLRAGVQLAAAMHHESKTPPDHVHQVIVSPGSGGGVASGSTQSVIELGEALALKADNPDKLRRSGAEQRHLFVWIDGTTPFSIERPLSYGPPSGVDGGAFGLPSEPPQLHPAITHLWVVHEGTGRGWLWDSLAWQSLEGLRSDSDHDDDMNGTEQSAPK